MPALCRSKKKETKKSCKGQKQAPKQRLQERKKAKKKKETRQKNSRKKKVKEKEAAVTINRSSKNKKPLLLSKRGEGVKKKKEG
jgi:hypothetical protein